MIRVGCCVDIAFQAAVHLVRFVLNQVQQPVFVGTVCFGISESGNLVNGMPVLSGHFHHRGVLRHCSSCQNQQRKRQHRVASRVAVWLLGHYSFSFSIPSVGIGNFPM